MIGKMKSGSAPKGLLNYCYYDKEKLSKSAEAKLRIEDVRGEVVYIQNLSLSFLPDGRFDMNYLANQFNDCASKNLNLKNFLWHQSFSFPQGENPSSEQIQEIVETFRQDFGFTENQLIVFKHNDTDNAHFHIVANRINFNGKTTADDGYSYLRTGKFCRKIEEKMGLQVTPDMKVFRPKQERQRYFSKSEVAESIRQKIDKHLLESKTISDLKTLLLKEQIKMYVGRGVSFLDKATGMSIKGSDLGREYSLMNLEKRLSETSKMDYSTVTQQLKTTKEGTKITTDSTPSKGFDLSSLVSDNSAPNGVKRKLDGSEDGEKEKEKQRNRKKRLKF